MLKAQSHRSKGTRKWNNTLIWQLGIGLVVLVLISAALTAGKYLSQRSTESRSQAAGGTQFTVCATGTPGVGGCDIVGLQGIQQALQKCTKWCNIQFQTWHIPCNCCSKHNVV